MIAGLTLGPVPEVPSRPQARGGAGQSWPGTGGKPPHAAPAAAEVRRSLQFQHDADLGRTILRVVKPETGEVLRQIPTEVQLDLARWLAFRRPATIDEHA